MSMGIIESGEYNKVAGLGGDSVISSDTITLDSNFTGTLRAVKRSGITSLVFANVKPISKTGSSIIAVLPAKYRPAVGSFMVLWLIDQCRIVNVSADGRVDIGGSGITSWFDNDTALFAWGTITYLNVD